MCVCVSVRLPVVSTGAGVQEPSATVDQSARNKQPSIRKVQFSNANIVMGDNANGAGDGGVAEAAPEVAAGEERPNFIVSVSSNYAFEF